MHVQLAYWRRATRQTCLKLPSWSASTGKPTLQVATVCGVGELSTLRGLLCWVHLLATVLAGSKKAKLASILALINVSHMYVFATCACHKLKRAQDRAACMPAIMAHTLLCTCLQAAQEPDSAGCRAVPHRQGGP